MSLLREHAVGLFWSVALHAAVLAALAFGSTFMRRPQEPQMLAIEAVVVDETMLARIDQQREAERQAELERQRQEAERQRQAELERQRQEAERQRQAELERQRQEQERQRQAELERQRQEAERQRQAELERQRQEAERRAQEEAERQAREEAERRAREEAERRAREEAERRAREEAERRAREEAERRRQEEELQRQLDAELQREAQRLAAMRSGALEEYMALLKNRIEQNWIRPPSARPGIKCTVHVVQIPSGEVVSARVTACNGDAAVVQSIEAAVLRASPLPLPSDRSLFERNLIIDFEPRD